MAVDQDERAKTFIDGEVSEIWRSQIPLRHVVPVSGWARCGVAGSPVFGGCPIRRQQVNPAAPLVFGRIASTIAVRDLDRALAFYRGVLGLRVVFENGDPVGFMILERDSAELHLTVEEDHRPSRHNVAHLLVSDATVLHDHLSVHGVRIVKGVRDADHGLRGFVFADPDGNRIDVGQRITR